MDGSTVVLIVVVVLALGFDFTNGFHDAANAIATSVSTRALRPRTAVIYAGIFNFIGAFVSIKVAANVAKGIVVPSDVTLSILVAGLVGSILWNLITWRLALPTSSSHALIGGTIGAVAAATAFGGIKWSGLLTKVLIPSALSPFVGLILAAVIAIAVSWLIYRHSASRVNRLFRYLQTLSAGYMAFAHGTNDAQKTMGLITLALIVHGSIHETAFPGPVWVIASAAGAMSAGTYAGGWRIIRTLGSRIVKLDPPQGFAAEAAAATVLVITGQIGYPVSTTHTITGAVMGAGATRRLSAVRWGVARGIVAAWLITIPAAAVVAAACYGIISIPHIGGIVLAVGVLAAIAPAMRGQRRARLGMTVYAPPE
jgi:PiT family inorganic phosphate transporter